VKNTNRKPALAKAKLTKVDRNKLKNIKGGPADMTTDLNCATSADCDSQLNLCKVDDAKKGTKDLNITFGG
jgi:hypothetical protein